MKAAWQYALRVPDTKSTDRAASAVSVALGTILSIDLQREFDRVVFLRSSRDTADR